MSQDATTLSGSIEDVATFFGVRRTTLHEWMKESPPRVSFWRDGRMIVFGEEAVIRYRAERTLASRKLNPGEGLEIARREWREHLGVRREAEESRKQKAEIEEIKARIEDLKKDVAGLQRYLAGKFEVAV